jgi:magnesium-transporting ATPase (P-type)
MYLLTLSLHNVLRWAVLVAAVYVLIRTLPGWSGRKAWTPADRRAGAIFTGFMDLQLLVGLALYLGVSPLMQGILSNFGAAMQDNGQRFFAVEHIAVMLLAVVFAHVGSVLSRNALSDAAKFRTASLWYGLSLIAMLALIPWWRPLLRVFGWTVLGGEVGGA